MTGAIDKHKRAEMKKKSIFLLVFLVAVFAAVFAFAGCNKGEEHITSDEYLIVADGHGRNYRLCGGETVVAYYEYDAEKELNFTEEFYDLQTGEKLRGPWELETQKCDSLQVRPYAFTVKSGGEYKTCYLTVIISAQAMTGQITEDGEEVTDIIYGGVGATYAFIPQMNGRYTLTSAADDSDFTGTVEYGITNVKGEWLGNSAYLNRGHRYFVHVAISGEKDDSVRVSTSVAFTPDVIKLGDNAVTLKADSFNTFEFTPEEYGIYSATDNSGNSLYQFLDGETYERITETQWEDEAVLEAGKKYYIDNQVGYAQPKDVTLTVKRVDNAFTIGEENELKWDKFYVFDVSEKCNYKFNVELQTNYSESSELIIYDGDGFSEHIKPFTDSGEFDILLDAGKHIIRVDNNCKATCMRAPKTLLTRTYAQANEVLSFTAPYNCEYDFTSEENTEIAVKDSQGNNVGGQKLTAGREYFVTVVDSDADSRRERRISVSPKTTGEFVQNTPIENFENDVPYAFNPNVSGRYKFTGASELNVYDEAGKSIATKGDTVHLQYVGKYIVVAKADTLTYGKTVVMRYFPQVLPVDGVTGVDRNTLCFELPFADEVKLEITYSGTINYRLLDADFNEVNSGSLASDNKTAVITAQLEAGLYYVEFSNWVEVKFETAPIGCGGICTVVEDDRYIKYAASGNTYRYACGLGNGEINLKIDNAFNLLRSSIKDEIKMYYMDGGVRIDLVIEALQYQRYNGWFYSWLITFKAKEEVGEYFLELGSTAKYEFSFK